MVDSQHATLSGRQQCEPLGLGRSSFYYQTASESALNLHLMRLFAKPSVCRHRCAVLARTLLWLAQDGRLSAPAGLCCQWQAGQAVDASDGHSSYLPQEKQQLSGQRAQALSLLVAQLPDYACQPGLECRHHLCAFAAWLHVPGRCHRLAQPLRARLAAFQHPRLWLLFQGPASGARQGSTQALQHRPGCAVHGRCLHRLLARGQHTSQHGRSWPRPRQRLLRTPIAQRKVRKHLSQPV